MTMTRKPDARRSFKTLLRLLVGWPASGANLPPRRPIDRVDPDKLADAMADYISLEDIYEANETRRRKT